jgi:hypothetical protein
MIPRTVAGDGLCVLGARSGEVDAVGGDAERVSREHLG